MNVNDIYAMFTGVSDEWRILLLRDLRQEFGKTIGAVNQRTPDRTKIVPPPVDIMAAFRECPWPPRVVLVGQDPYHDGSAMGLSFSVKPGRRLPPSLVNISKCLQSQGLAAGEFTGDLRPWAHQGVLLLNAALTTEAGRAKVHLEAWQAYTNGLIYRLAKAVPGLIFILLGNEAQSLEWLINNDEVARCHVLKWGHPSPLNRDNKGGGPRAFINCDAFRKANEILASAGGKAIDWNAATLAITAQQPPAIPPPTASTPTAAQAVAPTAVQATDDAVNIAEPRPLFYAFTDGGATGNGTKACKASWAYRVIGPVVSATGEPVKFIRGGSSDPLENVGPREVESTVDTNRLPVWAEDSGACEGLQTNQRGELMAIVQALKRLRELPRDTYTVFISDSQYSIRCITEWYPSWVAKGIVSEKKNTDLISQAYDAYVPIKDRMEFRHTRGHREEPTERKSYEWLVWAGNDAVDRACNTVLGTVQGRPTRLASGESKARTPKPTARTKTTARKTGKKE